MQQLNGVIRIMDMATLIMDTDHGDLDMADTVSIFSEFSRVSRRALTFLFRSTTRSIGRSATRRTDGSIHGQIVGNGSNLVTM